MSVFSKFDNKDYRITLLYLFLGAVSCCVFAVIHLVVTGDVDYDIYHFLVPTLFGGITGTIIGVQYIRLIKSYKEKIEIVKNSERKLRYLNKNLEELVKDKTKEISLQNLELKSSHEKLEELNATKDKFFSIIAHDLKNPIGSFKQATEVLLNDYKELNDEDKIDFLSF